MKPTRQREDREREHENKMLPRLTTSNTKMKEKKSNLITSGVEDEDELRSHGLCHVSTLARDPRSQFPGRSFGFSS